MTATHSLGRATLNRVTRERYRAHCRPRPRLRVSAWVERYLVLPASTTNQAGPFRLSVAPYLEEIFDAVGDPETERVTFIAPSQSAKTTFEMGVALYFAHQEPAPVLVVQPTLDMAQDFSKGRLTPTIEASPALRGLIAPARSRDSNNTILSKQYPGGQLDMAGANSPAGLASRPKRLVLFDEVDRYPEEAGEEGDPISIGEARTISFGRRAKVVVVTSPTDEPEQDSDGRWSGSRGVREYRKGTCEVYECACPDQTCGHWQVLTFDRLQWQTGEDGEVDRESIHYPCVACGYAITEADRPTLARRWRATTTRDKRHRSFHLEGLSAAFALWDRLATQFLKVKNDPVTLKTFLNTMLGVTWKDKRVESQRQVLVARAAPYSADDTFDVPREVGLLTCGVDVQGDRLEASVWGWGVGQQAWLITHQILHGDPTQPTVWANLDEWRKLTWRHESGASIGLRAVAIDSGDGNMSANVHRFCTPRDQVFAIRGASNPEAPIVPRTASKAKYGRVYVLGVNGLNERWAKRLTNDSPGPGYVHLNQHATEAFVKQLLGMERRVDPKTRKRRWMPMKNTRVEGRDCANYALGVLMMTVRDEELAGEVEARWREGEAAATPKAATSAEQQNTSWFGGLGGGSWMGRVR